MPEDSAGQVRRRQQRFTRFWDRVARLVITIGGLSVLAAVLGISVYLVWIALPLMQRGGAERVAEAETPQPGDPAIARIDEHLQLAASIGRDGTVRAWRARDAEPVYSARVGDGALTAWAATPDGERIALATDDGTIRVGQLEFASTLLADDPTRGNAALGRRAPELVERLKGLRAGESVIVPAATDGPRPRIEPGADSAGLVSRTGRGDLRLTALRLDLRPPVTPDVGSGRIIDLCVAQSASGDRYVGVLREDGSLSVNTVDVRESLMGGPPRIELSTRRIASDVDPENPPEWIFVTGDGEHLLAVQESGVTARYAVPPDAEPDAAMEVMERIRLSEAPLTMAGMLNGSLTLVVGTQRGELASHFVADDPLAEAPDARRLVRAHTFIRQGPAPVAIGASGRDRTFAVGFADGSLASLHATSGKRIARVEGALQSRPEVVSIAPKGDALLSLGSGGRYGLWAIERGHPSASLRTLFGKVRYEGSLEPQYVYQSSTPESREPKLSLIPLIFGTLKATLVAMIFATPLAVGAAIYSSEFLDAGVRRVVKPVIELMASMPSVVLGFIAALVVAPIMREILPELLAAFVVVPLTIVVAGVLWQALPAHVTRRMSRTGELATIAAFLGVGAMAASWAGPAMERALFRPSEADVLVLAGFHEPVEAERVPAWVGRRESLGIEQRRRLRRSGLYFKDGRVVAPSPPQTPEARRRLRQRVRESGFDEPSLRRWLDGTFGGAFPGWVLVLALPGFVAVASVRSLVIDRRLAGQIARLGTGAITLWVLGRFTATAAVAALVVVGSAAGMQALGMDPRDSIFGPFSLRNTLVVGLIMGFAVIPIIYTISEDALRSVPQSLRLASLGAGATPWQTAVRVVLPVAGSGIFSACMIGLGRAVGETMIVVMATGNTPQMGWNIFAGVRTLSANIAVELPEATQGGTHYRVLFLCGLVLFAMTFLINTTAEIVRQRFRKRNAAL